MTREFHKSLKYVKPVVDAGSTAGYIPSRLCNKRSIHLKIHTYPLIGHIYSLPRLYYNFFAGNKHIPIKTDMSTSTTTEQRKVALITGITGQDGSYLAELLLEKGYAVRFFFLIVDSSFTHPQITILFIISLK